MLRKQRYREDLEVRREIVRALRSDAGVFTGNTLGASAESLLFARGHGRKFIHILLPAKVLGVVCANTLKLSIEEVAASRNFRRMITQSMLRQKLLEGIIVEVTGSLS